MNYFKNYNNRTANEVKCTLYTTKKKNKYFKH